MDLTNEVLVTPDTNDSDSPLSDTAAPIRETDAPPPAAAAESGVYLPVYNGEVVRVQADDTQRVTGLLQKGLRFEQFSPQFDRLKTISRSLGCHKPEEAVEWMANALEQVQYEGILQEVGGNEAAARELLAARTAVKADGGIEPDRSTLVTERLANEFAELIAEFPEASDFDSLPDEVFAAAVQTGRSLTDCWLRYMRKEENRVRDAKESAAHAAFSSGGSLRSIPDSGVEATSRSFLAGFRSRL